ncbi:MAG: hypothetical protein ABFD77_09530, partial [Thermotogota bacterium]
MRAIIFSDTHFHDWTAFSLPTPEGYGTRFAEQLALFPALEEAGRRFKADCYLFGGDAFHRRANLFVPVIAHVRDGFNRLAAVAPVFSSEGN